MAIPGLPYENLLWNWKKVVDPLCICFIYSVLKHAYLYQEKTKFLIRAVIVDKRLYNNYGRNLFLCRFSLIMLF